jgi:hypothetical protein
MATRIIKTQVTGTSTQKFTLSAWVKKTSNTTGNDQVIYESFNDSSNRLTFYFRGSTNSTLNVYCAVSGTTILELETTRVFRDTNAWYHLVLAVDTTQAAGSGNQFHLYVNGVEESSFNSATDPSVNANLPMGTSSYQHAFGYYSGGGSSVFQGLMSHLNFVDGLQLDATSFGETDSTTGEWKIKTSPSVTYGNNGFFILKDGNSLTDQSGKTNNFTLSTGTLTNTEDSPSNVFATGNPLSPYVSRTISNGNLTLTSTTTAWTNLFSTLGVSTGKWYVELKATAGSFHNFGIVNDFPNSENASIGDFTSIATQQIGYYSNSGSKKVNETTSSYGDTWTNGDIISMALDLDNNKLYFAKNGTWQNSGVPTSGSTGTGAISVNSGYTYFIGASNYNSSATSFNFGNGYFGTTAVASAGTNASGNGIFEYDVPTGYTALSTKGLNL